MRAVRTFSHAAVVLLMGTSFAVAAPSINLSPAENRPLGKVVVSGGGFGANEVVDIYFDLDDQALAVTTSEGAITSQSLKVPVGALPGQHWITAIGRRDGDATQQAFFVGTPWTEYGFDRTGRSWNRFENVLNSGNVNQLDTMWIGPQLQGGFSYASVPVVSNGMTFIGGSDGSFYALDAVSGNTVWSTNLGNQPSLSPAIDDGVVYIGTYNPDRHMYAFDAATGTQIWNHQMGGSVAAPPMVYKGIVYVGGLDGVFYALDKFSGAEIWHATVAASIVRTPVIDAGLVYFSDGPELNAYIADTGQHVWSTTISGDFVNSLAVSGGLLYAGLAGTGGGAIRIYKPDGTVQGEVDNLGYYPAMAIAKGDLYVGSYSGLTAVNGRKLSVLWQHTAGLCERPSVANNVVSASCYDGSNFNVGLYGSDNGQLLWQTGGAALGEAVADGVLYVDADPSPGSDNYTIPMAFALNGGNNGAYRKRHTPRPLFATLHPNLNLKRPQ